MTTEQTETAEHTGQNCPEKGHFDPIPGSTTTPSQIWVNDFFWAIAALNEDVKSH